jgi:hypothetical protein
MKLSDKTISVLKNFGTINPSIKIDPGNTLRTVTAGKSNIYAEATVPDEFTGTVCIYELSKFLAVVSLYDDPEIEINDDHLIIKEGRRRTKYTFASPSMISSPPAGKSIQLPAIDVTFDLSWNDMNSVMKASSAMGFGDIAVVGEEGKIYLRCYNSDDSTSDQYGVEVGETEDTFTLLFRRDNLKLIQGDYNVELSSKGIGKFTGGDVTYFIAVEANKSKYTKGE